LANAVAAVVAGLLHPAAVHCIMQSVQAIDSAVLQAMEGALESKIIIYVSIRQFGFLVNSSLFPKFNPLTHVTKLCPDTSMQKNRVVFQVNDDSHVEYDGLVQLPQLRVVPAEYKGQRYHVER